MTSIKIYNVGAIPGSKLFSIRLNNTMRIEDEVVFSVNPPSNGKAELQSTLAKHGINVIDCTIKPTNWKVCWD